MRQPRGLNSCRMQAYGRSDTRKSSLLVHAHANRPPIVKATTVHMGMGMVPDTSPPVFWSKALSGVRHILSSVQGWILWLPEASVTQPPLISPGVRPESRTFPAQAHLPAATCTPCTDGPAGRFNRLLLHTDTGSDNTVNKTTSDVRFPGGILEVRMFQEAHYVSGYLQLSISDVHADVSSSGQQCLHCILAMEVHVKAVLHGPSGWMHIPLRCPLAQAPAGTQVPERISLSLIRVSSLHSVKTLCLSQPGEQLHYSSGRLITRPCGPHGLLNDVWLEACPGKDSQHTAFRLSRSPGLSLLRCHHTLPAGSYRQHQHVAEMGSKDHIYAEQFRYAPQEAPIQMSALLPGRRAQHSTINVVIEACVTVGCVPNLEERRHSKDGCIAASLPPGAFPSCWVQSLHRIPISSAWASLPVDDAE